jgi:hypothetical protein
MIDRLETFINEHDHSVGAGSHHIHGGCGTYESYKIHPFKYLQEIILFLFKINKILLNKEKILN